MTDLLPGAPGAGGGRGWWSWDGAPDPAGHRPRALSLACLFLLGLWVAGWEGPGPPAARWRVSSTDPADPTRQKQGLCSGQRAHWWITDRVQRQGCFCGPHSFLNFFSLNEEISQPKKKSPVAYVEKAGALGARAATVSSCWAVATSWAGRTGSAGHRPPLLAAPRLGLWVTWASLSSFQWVPCLPPRTKDGSRAFQEETGPPLFQYVLFLLL